MITNVVECYWYGFTAKNAFEFYFMYEGKKYSIQVNKEQGGTIKVISTLVEFIVGGNVVKFDDFEEIELLVQNESAFTIRQKITFIKKDSDGIPMIVAI